MADRTAQDDRDQARIAPAGGTQQARLMRPGEQAGTGGEQGAAGDHRRCISGAISKIANP